MPEMKTLTLPNGVTYEIVDATARESIERIGNAPMNGYATEAFVAQKIAEAQLGGSGDGADLSGFVTRDELNEAIENIELTPGPKGDPYVLTENDKNVIRDAVLSALPVWEGGTY